MQTQNVPFRVGVIIVLTLGGFVFPLLFALAGLVAWALIADLRQPPDPNQDKWFVRRYTTTAADPKWKEYFLPFCESPAETAFLEAMIAAYGLTPRKGVLYGGGIALDLQVKKPPYRLDFLVDRWLIVEIDGATYHSSPEAVERDRQRDAFFVAQGYTVLRIAAKIVFDTPQQAVANVRRAHAVGRRSTATAQREPARQNPLAAIGGFVSSAGKALADISAEVDRRLAVDKATSPARLAFESEKTVIDAALSIAESRIKIERDLSENEEMRERFEHAVAEIDAAVAARRVARGEAAPAPVTIHEFPVTAPPAHANAETDAAVQRTYANLVAQRSAYFATVRQKLRLDLTLRMQVREVLRELGGMRCWTNID